MCSVCIDLLGASINPYSIYILDFLMPENLLLRFLEFGRFLRGSISFADSFLCNRILFRRLCRPLLILGG